MSRSKMRIFDTTIRDGQQAPGFWISQAGKVEMVRALADLKADVIEAGFAAASPGDARSIETDVDSTRVIAANRVLAEVTSLSPSRDKATGGANASSHNIQSPKSARQRARALDILPCSVAAHRDAAHNAETVRWVRSDGVSGAPRAA